MPDLTLCTNEECPIKIKCHRYIIKPNPQWQSYARFYYNKHMGCEAWLPL